jgi:hypothetical protein
MLLPLLLLAPLAASLEDDPDALRPSDLPRGEEVRVDAQRREIRFAARVQHPRNKPCIDDFGWRMPETTRPAESGLRAGAGRNPHSDDPA